MRAHGRWQYDRRQYGRTPTGRSVSVAALTILFLSLIVVFAPALALAAASPSSPSSKNMSEAVVTASPERVPHTSNWAVIASTSRYWFNYRHVANALAIYRAVKQMGSW
jgi:glycosylphosphatidylinositol transamidase (GPIT) subunit GPI8